MRISRVVRGRSRALLVGSGLAVALAAAGCTPPPDTTPPALDAPPVAEFVVGSQVTRGADFGDAEITEGIQARVTWSATDEGEVCGYDVSRVFAGVPDELVLDDTTATEYLDVEDDYDDQFGGGSLKLTGWRVTATDCAGNSAEDIVSGYPIAMQEDGTTAYYDVPAPTYDGTWGTSSCTCWSGGEVARTTEDGATATFTNSTFARVALVMETAPNRGELRVLVNDKERAVVDTYAEASRSRVVVWEGPIDDGDVVEVENLATPGRPRIDLDAILVR